MINTIKNSKTKITLSLSCGEGARRAGEVQRGLGRLTLIIIFTLITHYCFAMIDIHVVNQTISDLAAKDNRNKALIEKGVTQTARLWQSEDGTNEDFIRFCSENYISGPKEKEVFFQKTSQYLEAIYGHFNAMTLRLQQNVHEATGELLPIDEMFAAYNPQTHLTDDFYANKIAFIIALNFPELSLAEKEKLGGDRLAWAYARMGDLFTARVPAQVQQAYSTASSDADVYISKYNIYAGNLLNQKNKKLFPENMVLLSHWNLRDEIKTNYNKGKEGLERQQIIYQVMKQIISQNIPNEVIDSNKYDWNPYDNQLIRDEEHVVYTTENTVRYEKMLNNFQALQAIDQYTGDTYIDRNFSKSMEVSVEDAEALFHDFLSAPELKQVGKMVSKRLGRKLDAFDIWYDGFKARSSLNEEKLSEQIRTLYPDAQAMEAQLPDILQKLGFTPERANYLGEKIAVDAARGSGHAWGAAMKGQKSHLRTRIPENGTDYKGYNIAMHELGHNVEQTISMYDVDYYMLASVPNTAFTEALAFVFQKRDLELLGISDNNPEKEAMNVLDKIWSMYEICGVSMLDIKVWKWLYANPNATTCQLRDATIQLSKEVWNQYFAPVFGRKDETVLAIYSHMISYPLYLSAYAFGQIIEFQLEQYFNGKDFAAEVDRIYRLGRLTPNQWMLQATGEPLSTEPMLKAVREMIR